MRVGYELLLAMLLGVVWAHKASAAPHTVSFTNETPLTVEYVFKQPDGLKRGELQPDERTDFKFLGASGVVLLISNGEKWSLALRDGQLLVPSERCCFAGMGVVSSSASQCPDLAFDDKNQLLLTLEENCNSSQKVARSSGMSQNLAEDFENPEEQILEGLQDRIEHDGILGGEGLEKLQGR